MKKISFRVRNFDKEQFLTYDIDNDAVMDEDTYDRIEDEEPQNIVPIIFEEGEDFDTFSYDVTDKIRLSELSNQEINAEMVLMVLRSLVVSLVDMGEYRIPLSYLVLNRDYIYIDSDYKVQFICIPLEDMQEDVDVNAFIRNLLASLRFELSEDCNYVAQLFTYINNPAIFKLRKLVTLVEDLMYEMNVEIPEDNPAEIYVEYQEVEEPVEEEAPETDREEGEAEEAWNAGQEEEEPEAEETWNTGQEEEEPEAEATWNAIREEEEPEAEETWNAIQEEEEPETEKNWEAIQKEEKPAAKASITDVQDEAEEGGAAEEEEIETASTGEGAKMEQKSQKSMPVEPEKESGKELETAGVKTEENEGIESEQDIDVIRKAAKDTQKKEKAQEEKKPSGQEKAKLSAAVAGKPEAGEKTQHEKEKAEDRVSERETSQKAEEKPKKAPEKKKTAFKTREEVPAANVILQDELDEFLAEKEFEEQGHHDDTGLRIKKNIKVSRASIVKNTQEELKAEEHRFVEEKPEEIPEVTEVEEEKADTSTKDQEPEPVKTELNTSGLKVHPRLTRVNTQEMVMVNRQNFKIGKASVGVNFSVQGNEAISRVHAIITRKNGEYYIKDNKSTNHVYVDGKRVPDGESVWLPHDCKIVMGDEEFTFML